MESCGPALSVFTARANWGVVLLQSSYAVIESARRDVSVIHLQMITSAEDDC